MPTIAFQKVHVHVHVKCIHVRAYVPNTFNVSDYVICRLFLDNQEKEARLERQKNLTSALETQIADEQEIKRQKTAMFEAIQEENQKLQERARSLEQKTAEDKQTITKWRTVAIVFICISAAITICASIVTHMVKRRAKNSNKISDPERNNYDVIEKQPLAGEVLEADQTDDTLPKKIDDDENSGVVVVANENTNYVAQPQVRDEIEATPLQETQLEDEIPGTQNNRTFS